MTTGVSDIYGGAIVEQLKAQVTQLVSCCILSCI